MDHTRLNTTVNFLGITRLTSRPTYWGSRQNRANCALTHSNVWTARANIKSVWTYALSGNIISIGNSTPRNTKNFETLEDNQLAQLWVAFKHDYQESQNVHKNKLLTNTVLEAQKEFDIIFIQELP